MTDKKLNVLDRLLCVFKPKKEIFSDIISQADNVVSQYIHVKNSIINRKCKKDNDTLIGFAVFASTIILGVVVVKLIF